MNGANMAEKALEIRTRKLLGCIPAGDGPLHLLRLEAGKQLRLEDIVAAERLARGVEHREHAMGAVDAGRRQDGNEALIQQEGGETLALGQIIGINRLAQVFAHADHALLRSGL